MPSPLTPSRRRARLGWGAALAVLALAGTAGLAGCTSTADDVPAPPATTTASSTPSASAASSAEVTTAVSDLLRRRAAAVVAGDESAYAATVADRSSAAGRRQLDSFGAARALRVSRLEVGEPVVDPVDLLETGPSTGATGSSRATAQVDVRYRVDDLDRGDRVARLEYDLVRSDAGWQVEAERPVGPGATAPWVAMPTLRVRRGEHAVVAGTVPGKRLAEHAAVVDRAVPTLRTQWSGTPSRVLVLAPSTSQEADALLGRTESGAAPVAATTEGPLRDSGTATGDRVVLDPTAFGRLTASGRDVVLTHELAHVAVRATVPGRPAGWLAEGYADHVGYARADVSTARLVAPLVGAIRTGHGPRRLPTTSDLQPTSGDIEVPYLAAWQAVELIAHDHGEAALRRLVAASASTGSDAEAEAATDAALVSVLHTTRAELTDRWLTRLGRLATNPG
ncbi:MAG TPA: hypothetical protein VFL10_14025 [Ornithinibacter sp.]|nr:hypothetical protein [Ornithinibacter sp.]